MIFSPKVSIVIPVYNGSNYMREAIDSALAQTYQNIEILVVNDGSTDNGATAEIASSYGDRIRYFSKKNGGVSTALNMGIREMTGEYFSWLSHDDVYYPYKIETQIEYLKNSKKKDLVLYSDLEFIDHESIFLRSHCIDNIEPIMFKYALITGNPIHGCTALLPKSCFDECGLFDETLITTQDYDMWFRIAKRYSFIHIPNKLIKSRLHDEQGSIVIKEHSKKITEYYIKCLNDIYHSEPVDECGKSLSVLYSKIAINLKKRKYSKASKCALRFSKKTIRKNSIKSYLIYVVFIVYWYVLNQWIKLLVIFKVMVKFLREKGSMQFDNDKSLNDKILNKLKKEGFLKSLKKLFF